MEYVNEVLDFLQLGFNRVNAVQGLLIAAVAAVLLKEWRRLWFVALGALAVHIVLDVMIPVLGRGAAFRLPPLVDPEYWRYAGSLYLGYLIIIAVFFFVKRNVARTAQGASH